jgi:tRNA A-37 threonylcarbamoyl transferase component Bud32/tetratricopeptide (TPR) repeat protein
MIGQTISHYKILEKLGEGGMGVVYKARDLKLPRFVALKFLPPHLSSDEDAKRRFIHEAEAASALDHPNIGTIYEIDETPDGQMFIAMAYYEGQTLKQRAAGEAVGIDEAIDIVSQIASGLAKAHESEILHRDVKPANVLLTSDGHAKIVDFGLAKLSGATRVTRTGTTVGTVTYMSPEQARGEDLDARSDVFSAGVVLYELLTGRLPFPGDQEAAVIYSITNADPEPLTAHRQDLPADAQRVIDKALAKDRDDRYDSASELLADLKRLQEGRQVAALEKRARRRIGRRVAMYAAIALVVVIAGYAVISRLVPTPTPEPAGEPPADLATNVAVLPFVVSGGDEIQDLGRGIVDLMSERLDGAGTLRCVDPRALLDYIDRREASSFGPEAGQAVADHFGAGQFLLGNIMDVGDKLMISASMYRSGESADPPMKLTVQGQRKNLLAMADDLAGQLVVDRLGGIERFPFDPDALTGRAYPVLKLFFEGEAKFRASAGSRSSFNNAVELDSTFSMALYRLATSYWWGMRNLTEARGAVNQALRHSQGLPDQERLRLRAFRAELYEEDLEAEQLYRTIVSNYPRDHEAWFRLGATQALACPRRGLPPSVAWEALERTFVLDPGNWQANYYATVLAFFERDYERAAALIAERWPDEDPPMRYRSNPVFAVGDSATQEEVMTELRDGNEAQLIWSACRIALYTDDPRRSRDVVGLMTDPVRSDEVRGLGHVLLAYLEAARGRWKAAAAEFKAAESFNPAMALEFRALVAAMPFLAVPKEDLVAIRDGLDSWDPRDVDTSLSPQAWFQIYDDIHPQLRVYLLGLLNARLGEYDRALRQADELERFGGPPHVTGLMRDFVRGIRAQVAWQRGDVPKALEEIQRIEIKSPSSYRVWSPFYKESHERYLRAELLHQAGRHEEALGWTGSFGHIIGFEFAYLAPIHLRTGQYFEKVGQTEQAAEHYAIFIKYWQDCDEELRPLVNEAREKLGILTAADR